MAKHEEFTIARTRSLRKHPTDAENKLWFYLRSRRFSGHKFRRQHPIGPYFIDFYCAKLRIGIELDGGGHQKDEQKKHDQRRSSYLLSRGVEIVRFWNNDFLTRTEDVLNVVWKHLNPSPCPLPKGARGIRADNFPPHPTLAPLSGEREKLKGNIYDHPPQ